jgi:hypothetical protein
MNDNAVAAVINISVVGNRSRMISSTGREKVTDQPRSPRTNAQR